MRACFSFRCGVLDGPNVFYCECIVTYGERMLLFLVCVSVWPGPGGGCPGGPRVALSVGVCPSCVQGV